MYNVDVGGRLGATGTAVGLSIRVSGCRGNGLRAVRWTGGTMRAIRQEGFDQVLSAIRSGRASGGRILVPLESLTGDEGRLINRVGARAASDFVVLVTSEATCNDYPDNCAKDETANTRPDDDSGRNSRFPGQNIRYRISQDERFAYGGAGSVLRQAVEVVPPPPLCCGPLDHETPLESDRVRKKGDPQERDTVQLMGLISDDMILYGG